MPVGNPKRRSRSQSAAEQPASTTVSRPSSAAIRPLRSHRLRRTANRLSGRFCERCLSVLDLLRRDGAGADAADRDTGAVCGLIGFLSADGQAANVAGAVDEALPQMRHRGPDEGGVWHDKDAAIGFRRLSIIDIDRSHQPLPWLEGRYQLIFNGEIYNYVELRDRLAREFGARFETDGDGEAIVAGYHFLGPKIVRELRGMFVFLIWDSQERVLFGARDWFGIKPLFSYADERGTFFASEKKSLLDVAAPGTEAAVDMTAVQHYLTLQYVPEPATMHRAVRRIESGTSFTLAPGGHLEPHRYFHPDFA